MNDPTSNRGRTPCVSAASAGAAWSLFAAAAFRVVRTLFGPYPADGAWPAAAFGVAFLLSVWITGRPASPRFARIWRVVRSRPIGLALILAFFPKLAGWLGPGQGVLAGLFLLILLAAGFSLGASVSALERTRGGARALLAALGTGAAGCFLATWILIPWSGVSGTGLIAAGLFLIAAVRSPSAPGGADERVNVPSRRPALVALILLGMAVSVTLLAELRIQMLITGPTFRAEGMFIGAFAALVTLGAALAALAGRRSGAPTWAVIGAALTGAGVIALLSFAPELPYLFVARIRGLTSDPAALFWTRLVLSFSIAGPAALFGGFAGALLFLRLRGAGGEVRFRAASCAAVLGLLAGSLATPGLVGTVGIRGALSGATAFALVAALLVLLGERVGRVPIRAAVTVALALALVVVLLNPPRWKAGIMNTAPYRYARLYEQIGREDFERTYELLPSFYEEGRRRTVMVSGVPGSRLLAAEGVVEISDRERLPLQKFLGRLPLLYRPDAKRAYLCGAGAGIVAGTLLKSGLEELRAVEAEPAYFEAMRHFSRVNDRPWEDERVRFDTGDPRIVLAGDRSGYDIIVARATAPCGASEADRMTDEFFSLAAARLRPGGVFAVPVVFTGIREDHLATFLRGFRRAFPFLAAFRAGDVEAVILLGSDEPLVLQAAELLDTWSDVPVQADLRQAGVRTVSDLIALFRLDAETADRFAAGAAPNTDGNAFVEFDAEADAFELGNQALDAALLAAHVDFDRLLAYDGMTEEERAEFELDVARAFRALGYGPGGLLFAGRSYRRRPTGTAATLYADFLVSEADDVDSAIVVVKKALADAPGNPGLIRQLGDYEFSARRFEDCEALMTRSIAGGFRESWVYVLRGKARLALRRHEEGLHDLLEAKDLDRLQDRKGTINFLLGMATKNLGRLEESQDWLGRALRTNPRHIYARYEYGENKRLLGRIDQDEFESEYLQPFTRARADSIFERARDRLLEPQHAAEVELDLMVVLNTTPNHYGAYLALAELYFRTGEKEKERNVLTRMLDQFGRSPEAVSAVREYLRRAGGAKRIRENSDLLK